MMSSFSARRRRSISGPGRGANVRSVAKDRAWLASCVVLNSPSRRGGSTSFIWPKWGVLLPPSRRIRCQSACIPCQVLLLNLHNSFPGTEALTPLLPAGRCQPAAVSRWRWCGERSDAMLLFINTSQHAPKMRSPGYACQYEDSASAPNHKRGHDLGRSGRLRLNLLAQKSHPLFASRKTGGVASVKSTTSSPVAVLISRCGLTGLKPVSS